MVGKEVKRLEKRLKRTGTRILSVFPNYDNKSLTAEKIAREINKSLDELERNGLEELSEIDYND